jgi:RHS repeat-associated protein
LRTSLALEQQNLSNWTHTYAYDSARRLSSVSGSSGTFNYTYTSASGTTASRLIHRITLPTTSAGPSITNTYDNVGRLLTTHMRNGGTIFNKHDYVVDSAHRRTKQTRTDNSYVNYSYDPASQLRTAEAFTSGGTPITTEQLRYGYDEAQNMVKRTNHTAVSTYTVNARNQVTSDGTYSYTYDANGNRTFRATGAWVEYQYDDENQLVSARTDTSSTHESYRWRTDWTYDARGRIRQKTEYTWLSGSWYPNGTIRYVYDGMRVIQQRSSSNVSQVTYTRGPDLSGSWEGAGGIGGLLARTAHSGSWGVTYTHAFYHADGNGNITYLLNMNQSLGAAYRYDAYGRTLSSSGTLAGANVYRFSSKELMIQSGLYYYGYRFYDPLTQRWMNRDPLGEPGFESLRGSIPDVVGDGHNLYAFVQDGQRETDLCKQRCHDWINALIKSGAGGFNLDKALKDCLAGCDRDPNHIPSPIPPLPTPRPVKPPSKPLWPIIKECVKGAIEAWKDRKQEPK